MTTPVRRRWRLLRRGGLHAVAALLVVLALGNGLGSQLLPLAERHPERIAAWLGARVQGEVAFERVETEWTRRGPLLRLDGLRIGDPANPLRVGDAEILVAQYAGLLPGRSFTELRLRGLELTLLRDAGGRWSVRGLPGQQQAAGDPFAMLERLGELQVSDARLHVVAPGLGIDLRVPDIDLRLQVDGARIRAGAHARLRPEAEPLSLALDFDRTRRTGRVHVASRRADLRDFDGGIGIAGVVPVRGRGRVRAWGRLEDARLVAVRADAALEGVVLRGTPLRAGGAPPALALGKVEFDASWEGDQRQWRAGASRLRIGEADARQVLDGIGLAGGERFALHAARVDAAPLMALLGLSGRTSPGVRQWLLASRPGMLLEDVVVQGVRDGPLRVQAGFRGLRFAPVGERPGVRGVAGRLDGDAGAVRVRFDPAAQAAFDWPAGFGVVHGFRLEGEAVAWREGDGWTLRTPGLAIAGEQFRARTRGGIAFANDGSRPRLDLVAEIGHAPVTAARGFWIRHLMPEATVGWLDAALQGGMLHDIRAVVAGDLDDWPFRPAPGKAGAGVFRVDARLEDGVVRFQPGWPAAQRIRAEVAFEADGFRIAGSGGIAGVRIDAFEADIPHFDRAELRLDAEASGNARDFLGLLRASPLHAQHRETLDNLGAAGVASANLHMRLPMHRRQPPPQVIEGRVRLRDAALREARWQLAFDRVNGEARFDRAGFAAHGLQVLHDGMPGVLSLRTGPHVRDPAQAFEAELQASVGIETLLDRAGSLDWLVPHVAGRSPWTVAVAVPRGGRAGSPPTRMQLRSSLVGTAINLPAPLRKPAAQALAATVDVHLPASRGEIEVTLGDLLSLRSRTSGRHASVRALLGGGRAELPGPAGLFVSGRAASIDALEWIGVVGARGGSGVLPLRRIELQAGQLRLLGARFAGASLLVVPSGRDTAVQVRAAGIAGSLLVPGASGAQVAGRFERLHWRNPPAVDDARAMGRQPAPGSGLDPAKIPPLVFEVADLRIGDAALGSARFRSTPTVGGLRMEEFGTRGGPHRVSASGAWTGRGALARTRLQATVDSDDIGALLAGLGLGGQVHAGTGRLAVDAAWAGGPEAAALATMEAGIALDARDGRLLELEPGAGRVLGLLGIAQLPRRLTLDFRDFFDKGFAFDRITGAVQVSQGQARTRDLAIRGPAADIHVRGSADLRNRRFDQTVDVLPKTGGLLTAVGALAGGPVGAAVGAVANAVLDKPLQALGAKSYRVSGPWASPTVEVTARGTRAARPNAPPPG